MTGAPDIRFYAGAPLVTSKGSVLGTLCVIDRRPRRLSAIQRRTLEVLGRQVVAQLELRLLATRALELTQAKSRFFALMSHELRTPKSAILGFSAFLKKESLDPKALDYVERIHASGPRLLDLINDVLDLSKVEAGKLKLSRDPVDVRALAEGVVGELEGLTPKGVVVVLECPEGMKPLETDAQRLRQILMNLGGNALKFTERGEVRLQIEGQPATPPTALRIVDTGIGMTNEQVEVIFRPFEQAEAGTARKYGGTGLGLALCRELSKRLGFELTVQSEPGKGSVFSCCLKNDHPSWRRHVQPGFNIWVRGFGLG